MRPRFCKRSNTSWSDRNRSSPCGKSILSASFSDRNQGRLAAAKMDDPISSRGVRTQLPNCLSYFALGLQAFWVYGAWAAPFHHCRAAEASPAFGWRGASIRELNEPRSHPFPCNRNFNPLSEPFDCHFPAQIGAALRPLLRPPAATSWGRIASLSVSISGLDFGPHCGLKFGPHSVT